MNKSYLMIWMSVLLAPLPLLTHYYQALWQIEQYQYFPVLLLAVALLFWERWDRTLRGPGGWLEFLALALGGLTLLAATISWSPWIANVGWLMLWFSFLRSQRGELASLAYIWPPMLLLVRPPLNFDERLTSFLQSVTSRVSSNVLDRLEVPHTLTGNVFDLPAGRLFVEDACSGVQSLFTLLFVAFFLVAWLKRSAVLLPAYAIAGVLWAAVMNVVRIVLIALAQEWYTWDLSHGWQHEVLGYLCLGAAILMLMSTDRLVRVCFYPLPTDSVVKFNPLVAVWNWFLDGNNSIAFPERNVLALQKLMPVFVIACVCLIAAQIAMRPSSAIAAAKAEQGLVWQPPADLFGDRGDTVAAHEAVRGGTNIELGSNSDIWHLNIGGLQARAAVSQPYNEFHNLCVCYEATGWTQNESSIVRPADSDWRYTTATFVGADGQYGTLVFSGIAGNGDFLNPVEATISGLLASRVRGTGTEYSNLMIQLWSISGTPHSPDQVDALISTHLANREQVRLRLESGLK